MPKLDKLPRRSTELQRRNLKTMVEMLRDLIGPNNYVARLTRGEPCDLSRYIAPHEVDRQAPIDVVLDLELNAGEPLVTGALAMAQGYELVRMSRDASDGQVALADLQLLHRDAANAVTAIMDGIADQKLTPAEKKRILKELAELRHAISAIEAKVEGA